jgi:hypothetical protein
LTEASGWENPSPAVIAVDALQSALHLFFMAAVSPRSLKENIPQVSSLRAWLPHRAILAPYAVLRASGCGSPEGIPDPAEEAVQAALLHDIFDNPFRPKHALNPAWVSWQGGIVKNLAEAAYEERSLPDGTFDQERLAVLADALEDAGCENTSLLLHLRSEGPHVRGCWALDLILGKE